MTILALWLLQILFMSNFRTLKSKHMMSVLQIPKYKHALLGFKHVCHLSALLPPELGQLFLIAVKTTESILSAVTTGWLSHLSDRFGRKGILALSMFGALFMSVPRS
jgi:hypothetical protein